MTQCARFLDMFVQTRARYYLLLLMRYDLWRLISPIAAQGWVSPSSDSTSRRLRPNQRVLTRAPFTQTASPFRSIYQTRKKSLKFDALLLHSITDLDGQFCFQLIIKGKMKRLSKMIVRLFWRLGLTILLLLLLVSPRPAWLSFLTKIVTLFVRWTVNFIEIGFPFLKV